MWNSRRHKLLGLAMTSEDLRSLIDIYKILHDPDTNKQTSYVLQFLWRDLTSCYDIVGSYFTSYSTVEGKFIIACIFETIKLFQFHGLKTSVLYAMEELLILLQSKPVTDRHHGAYSVTDGENK